MNRNIYRNFDEFLREFIPELNVSGRHVDINRVNCKDTILEWKNVNYTVIAPEEGLVTFDLFKPKPIWAVCEVLSEFLNLNPPLQERYAPGHLDSFKRKNFLQNYSYGQRLHANNQIENIAKRLVDDHGTRQAVLIFSDPSFDTRLNEFNISCTLTTQFLIREGKLHSIVNMRSQDLTKGFVYDSFFQSILLEAMAGFVGVETGTVSYNIGSLHAYSSDLEKIENFSRTAVLQESSWATKLKPIRFCLDMEGFFGELWKVKAVEDAAFFGNFVEAMRMVDKIKTGLFQNWAMNFITKSQGHKNYMQIR